MERHEATQGLFNLKMDQSKNEGIISNFQFWLHLEFNIRRHVQINCDFRYILQLYFVCTFLWIELAIPTQILPSLQGITRVFYGKRPTYQRRIILLVSRTVRLCIWLITNNVLHQITSSLLDVFDGWIECRSSCSNAFWTTCHAWSASHRSSRLHSYSTWSVAITMNGYNIKISTWWPFIIQLISIRNEYFNQN